MYFDTPYMLPLLNLRGTTDSGALGIGNNPGGGDPVATASANNAVIVPNQPIFPTLGQALAGVLTGAGGSVTNAYSVNPNYRQSYTYSYNLNAQQSLGSGVIAQIGYVGTLSRHLTEVQDINAAQQGSAGAQNTRPYYSQFPGIGTVNQLESDLNSNYNSLQTLIRTSRWHGLTTQASYTWSHAMDYETGLVPYLPQNSLNIAAEYSNSDFDTRNTFSAYANYDLPNMSKGPRVLTNGWELNTGAAFHSGQPFSVVASSNTSGNGDNADRAELLPGVNPFAGVSHSIVAGYSNLVQCRCVSECSHRNLQSNHVAICSTTPGFEDIDLSVFQEHQNY